MDSTFAGLSRQPLLFALCMAVIGFPVGFLINAAVAHLPRLLERQWQMEARDVLGLSGASAIPCRSTEQRRNGPISRRQVCIALANSLLSGIVALHFGFGWSAILVLALSWGLLTMSLIDAEHLLLPDILVIPLLWLGLVVNSFHQFALLQDALWGAVAGYGSLWCVLWLSRFITGHEGIGRGDLKLLAMLGAWGGWQILPLTIILASAMGVAVRLIMIRLHKAERSEPIPFGPYLSVAGWSAFVVMPGVSIFSL